MMPGTVDRDSSLQNLGVRGREWLPSGEEPGMPSFLKHLYQDHGSSNPAEGEPMKTVFLLASLPRTHLPGKVLHLGRGAVGNPFGATLPLQLSSPHPSLKCSASPTPS